MRTLGIVGGLGHESTIDYYRTLVVEFRERERRTPRLVIDSLDVGRLLDLLANDRPGAIAYLSDSLQRLAAAGAQLALIAANTPHLVFDEVASASPIPLLSIVDCAVDEARARGYARVGLLGTRLTMEGGFFQRAGAARGVRIVTPDPADARFVHEKYVSELLEGRFLDDTRQAISAVVERMRERDGVQAVILGGTELVLLLRERLHADVALLDTTRLHLARALEAISAKGQVAAPGT